MFWLLCKGSYIHLIPPQYFAPKLTERATNFSTSRSSALQRISLQSSFINEALITPKTPWNETTKLHITQFRYNPPPSYHVNSKINLTYKNRSRKNAIFPPFLSLTYKQNFQTKNETKTCRLIHIVPIQRETFPTPWKTNRTYLKKHLKNEIFPPFLTDQAWSLIALTSIQNVKNETITCFFHHPRRTTTDSELTKKILEKNAIFCPAPLFSNHGPKSAQHRLFTLPAPV